MLINNLKRTLSSLELYVYEQFFLQNDSKQCAVKISLYQTIIIYFRKRIPYILLISYYGRITSPSRAL